MQLFIVAKSSIAVSVVRRLASNDIQMCCISQSCRHALSQSEARKWMQAGLATHYWHHCTVMILLNATKGKSQNRMFGRIFLLKLFWNQKIVSGSKIQKLKNDVLQIALDQWNERVRRYSANEICLFALFPRALLLLLQCRTLKICKTTFKIPQPIRWKLEFNK